MIGFGAQIGCGCMDRLQKTLLEFIQLIYQSKHAILPRPMNKDCQLFTLAYFTSQAIWP